MKEIFSIISAIVLLIGFIWYSYAAKKEKPNFVVVSSWLVFSIINTVTYMLIVDGAYKAFFQIAGTAANIWIFIVLIRSGNYISLKRDWIIIICSSAALIIIGTIINVKNMHILMQILITVPYIPLIMGIIQGKGKEPIKPWLVMTLGVAIGLIPILMNYSDFWSLIHPVRSMILQLVVVGVSYVKLSKKAPGGAFAIYGIYGLMYEAK